MNEHRDLALEARIQHTLDVGNHVWVVGDVHGYFETLQELLKKLDYTDDDVIIFMGDLIDKGPNSKEVFELVTKADNFFSIRGNHEEMLRLSLTPKYKGRMKKSWLKYGGTETLKSINPDQEKAIIEAKKWIPVIEKFPTELVLDNFRLVHAGYNPLKSLEEQSNRDMMWNRDIFTSGNIFDMERQIIVGHTPIQKLENENIGSYWTTKLNSGNSIENVFCLDSGIFLDDQDSALIACDLQTGVLIKTNKIESYIFQVRRHD